MTTWHWIALAALLVFAFTAQAIQLQLQRIADALRPPDTFYPGKEGFAGWVREHERKRIIEIVRAQPFYPDTHSGLRQQWMKDQIIDKIEALK